MTVPVKGQLEFRDHRENTIAGDWAREVLPDRNHKSGGKSFYFFDIDDNILNLDTKIVLFDSEDQEREVSTSEFSKIHPFIFADSNPAATGESQPSEWSSYKVIDDDKVGSYRKFRDQDGLSPDKQGFVQDIEEALRKPRDEWRGPSWRYFEHAVASGRSIALITARGHSPETILAGMNLLIKRGELHPPNQSKDRQHLSNWLGIYPVTYSKLRHGILADPNEHLKVAELKKRAIVHAVDQAFQRYGQNSAHRFGMSDDDEANVRASADTFSDLKKNYRHNAFYVIHTGTKPVQRWEVLENQDGSDPRLENREPLEGQLRLF